MNKSTKSIKTITTHEAKTHLSRLLAEVGQGGEVVIARGREPVARLVPVRRRGKAVGRPKVGVLTSEPVKVAADAFAPLEDADLAAWGLE
jgi:prevent-host-death family protein